jgi:hypothetical protein
MSARYTAVGSPRVSRSFHHWGRIPEGYDVFIEIRDLRENRSGRVYSDGDHYVVVTGPQPRPRSKSFKGELAWCDAERYAGDVVHELQAQVRRERDAAILADPFIGLSIAEGGTA